MGITFWTTLYIATVYKGALALFVLVSGNVC